MKKALICGLVALFVLAVPAVAGADPRINDHNSAMVVDCDDGPSFLVQFATGSVALFDPSEENNGRKYALLSAAGTVEDSDGEIVDEYSQVWGKRNGYHGDPIVCAAIVEFTFAHFGTFTEYFTATLISKN